MKVCSAVLFVAVFAFLYLQSTEAKVSKCYHCLMSCDNPVEVQTCPSTGDFNCLLAKIETGTQNDEVRGCVASDDSTTKQYCDQINSMPGGKCYICDSDLCNSA
ncbi:hypothetical protein TcasGA2_TC033404 [Tribolium castaneum]|uniref:Protein sleepless n=1 Tax=Tribolium castaneum TaxID=7070 RepID=A0A139WGQ9_TRICA|nr:PREDICTED: uncharacterized protein LOC103313391 [Tribolium castaneum]KYB27079.1 hypothetical protein TcasGA2_TC033404 [Tribolium castaneum]|eukprot:XP_008194726.1 PREDICTED: uncharacterized protein LOC103313391 [Tribolium castaneum]